MVRSKISRHFSNTDIRHDGIDSHIAIYEDQVFGWFIDQARLLQKVSDHCGLIILHLCLSYIEGHAIFYQGRDSRNQSKQFFRDAFKAIFPLEGDKPEIIDKAVDELYDQIRCGLFHTGLIREKVVLAEIDSPVQIMVNQAKKELGQIHVNPDLFLDFIENHVAQYLMRLRDPSEQKLRENFEKAWKLRIF